MCGKFYENLNIIAIHVTLICLILLLLSSILSAKHFGCLSQVCNFLVGLFFLDLVEKYGVAPVYGSFGAVSLLAAIFANYFIVETKGRSLEEIEMSLNSKFIGRGK